MSHDRNDDTNLERRQELRHEEETFKLRQEEKRLQSAKKYNTYIWITNSIFWLTGMLEILLIIRFVLRLFGANPKNDFALVINNISAPFIAPFSTLFISPTAAGGANIFDVNVIIAIAIYAVLMCLAASLVRFVFNRPL